MSVKKDFSSMELGHMACEYSRCLLRMTIYSGYCPNLLGWGVCLQFEVCGMVS